MNNIVPFVQKNVFEHRPLKVHQIQNRHHENYVYTADHPHFHIPYVRLQYPLFVFQPFQVMYGSNHLSHNHHYL